MGNITKVTHGVGLPQRDHLAIVPGGAEMEVVDFASITLAAAD